MAKATDVTPNDAERRAFGDLAEDVAYLRRGCHLTVAPYRGGFRVGEGAAVEVINAAELRARAPKERETRGKQQINQTKRGKAASIPMARIEAMHACQKITRTSDLTPVELAEIKSLYHSGEITNVDLAARYGQRPNWINFLASKHGWTLRRKKGKAASLKFTPYVPARRRHAKPGRSIFRGSAEYAAEQRAYADERERDLYGSLTDDANLLRRRGWVVTRERDGFHVGNDIISGAEMHAKAERERRLQRASP